jgi:signal transduction histidine kinase
MIASNVIGDLAGSETNLPQRKVDPARNLERLAAIGLMTAGVVHDVGNLMQIIKSGARLAARKLDCGAGAEALEAIARLSQAADRASALGRTLLDRAASRGMDTHAIDLAAALAGMAQSLSWAVGPSVQLEIVVPGLPLTIVCDRDALEDALVNLALNARDAMPGGGKAWISARPILIHGAPVVEIRVCDTGVGMSREVAARAFDPFFSTKITGGGSGLGLASVAAFVRTLDGEATIESEPGKGCAIVMKIPLDEA